MELLQAYLIELDATMYARIDQQAVVNKSGQNIFSLEFILYGNPKVGGPLLAENPLVALNLPLKVIVWEDDRNKVYMAYNDAIYIEERYSLFHNPNFPLFFSGVINAVLKK